MLTFLVPQTQPQVLSGSPRRFFPTSAASAWLTPAPLSGLLLDSPPLQMAFPDPLQDALLYFFFKTFTALQLLVSPGLLPKVPVFLEAPRARQQWGPLEGGGQSGS